MEAKVKRGTFLAESCGRASDPPPNGPHHPKVPLFLTPPLIANVKKRRDIVYLCIKQNMYIILIYFRILPQIQEHGDNTSQSACHTSSHQAAGHTSSHQAAGHTSSHQAAGHSSSHQADGHTSINHKEVHTSKYEFGW